MNFYEKNRDVNYAHDYANYIPENDSHYDDLVSFIDKYYLNDSKILEIGSSGGFFQDIVEDYSGTDVSKLLSKHYHKRYKVVSKTGESIVVDDYMLAQEIWWTRGRGKFISHIEVLDRKIQKESKGFK